MAADIFGKIPLPAPLAGFGDVQTGPAKFLNRMFQFIVVIAGVYALFNLLIAGYSFMGAGEDPKKVAAAWQKIWQSMMGLAFTAGAFVLAAIFGKLIFNDWGFILNPTIPTQ